MIRERLGDISNIRAYAKTTLTILRPDELAFVDFVNKSVSSISDDRRTITVGEGGTAFGSISGHEAKVSDYRQKKKGRKAHGQLRVDDELVADHVNKERLVRIPDTEIVLVFKHEADSDREGQR